MILPSDWALPERLRRRLGEKAGRQRALFADGHLLLVLHKVPEPGNPERVPMLYWRDPEGQWQCNRSSAGVQALQMQIANYERAVEASEQQYAQARQASEWFAVLRSVIPLHRATNNLLGALQSAREQVGDDLLLITLRDRAADLERATELLHSDASNALQYTVAKQAEEHAQVSNRLALAGHRLNVLAAIFLPATAIASIFGMRLASGLEGGSPVLFWTVALVSGMVGLLLGGVIVARSPRLQQHEEPPPG